jgi:hypothetical protein
VPPSKLQLGVPTYGRHWAVQKRSTEVCPDGVPYRDSITMKEGAPLAAQHGVTPVRHSSGELTFTWDEVVSGPRTKPITPPAWIPPPVRIGVVNKPADPGGLLPAQRLAPPNGNVTCTVQHIVYYPDQYSVQQRADAAVGAHWSGIVLFAIGYETIDVYTQLAQLAPQRPNGAPSGAFDPAVVTGGVTGGDVRIRGKAVHPEFDLPVPVRITAAPTGGGAVLATRTVLANVQRADVPAPLGPFHGFDVTMRLGPGTYDICGTVMRWGGVTGPPIACQSVTVPVAP